MQLRSDGPDVAKVKHLGECVNSANIDQLVIGGAGLRFSALLGALYALRKRIKSTKHFLGVSAGALIGTLLALGCTAKEMFLKEKDVSFTIHWKMIASAFWQFARYGNGLIPNSELRNHIQSVMEHLRPGSSHLTFAQLYLERRCTLEIQTFDWHEATRVVFSRALTPDALLLDAITASSSIPFVFSPFEYRGKILCDSAVFAGVPWASLLWRHHIGKLFMPVVDPVTELKIDEPLVVGLLLVQHRIGHGLAKHGLTKHTAAKGEANVGEQHYWITKWLASYLNPREDTPTNVSANSIPWLLWRLVSLPSHVLRQEEQDDGHLIRIHIDPHIHGSFWWSMWKPPTGRTNSCFYRASAMPIRGSSSKK